MDKVPFCFRSFTHPEESGMPGALVPALALHAGWAREASCHGKREILSSAMSFHESSLRHSPSRSLGERFASARPFLPQRSLSSRFLPHLSFDSVHYASMDGKRSSQPRGCLSGEDLSFVHLSCFESSRRGEAGGGELSSGARSSLGSILTVLAKRPSWKRRPGLAWPLEGPTWTWSRKALSCKCGCPQAGAKSRC